VVKKQLIMEKSLELFAENGFEATSVQQITQRCGISKGAFYLYFKSKDELINSLIDQYMSRFIAEIEQSVNGEIPKEELLYNFLYISFREFEQQASFAKVFLKEQVVSFNEVFLSKMHVYITMINKILSSIVQRQFPDVHPNMHLDLVFTISGLMKSHGELFLIDNYKIDLILLCNSIVEKVTVIAEHAKIQAISPEYLNCLNLKANYTKEQLIELLESIHHDIDYDSIIGESLQLLKNHLQEPSLSQALLQGLLKNIKENDNCKWVAYLYQQYLQTVE
jgi:AcrR family transcriptional regulator